MASKRAVLCLFLSVPGIGWGYDAAYVATVKSEVEEFSTGRFTLAGANSWAPEGNQILGQGVERNLQREFEALLRKRMPGTFIQYRRLSAARRAYLFSFYRETGDLEQVRRKILATLHHRH